MDELKNVFQVRTSEIQELFNHIRDIERTSFSSSLFGPTLKATFFLLFYNLLENIIYVMFEILFDRINQENLKLCMLNDKIQKQYKRYRSDKISAQELTQLSFERYSNNVKLFSGNLDAREIRKLLKNWGISDDFHVVGEQKLLEIKNYRNTLAHGQRSFKVIGREYSLRQIDEDFFRILKEYIQMMIHTYEEFLEKKKYIGAFDDKYTGK